MTTTKIILAGVLGAVAMFVWTSIAHMALPLGEAGVTELPKDEAVLAALKTSAGDKSGFYIYPGMGLGPDATHQQRNAVMDKYVEKLEKNPSGFIIYHPAGSRPMNMAKFLTIEFATELCRSAARGLAARANPHLHVRRPGGFCHRGRNPRRDRDKRFVLELVGFSDGLHRVLHVHSGRRIFLGWSSWPRLCSAE